MPVDQRRINGPEISVPYQLFTVSSTKSLTSGLQELVKPDGTRADGRKPNDHRKIFLKTGVVTQAKGSAYIEVNNTKVIVSVFDPREIPNKNEYNVKGEIYCEFKFAPFSCYRRRQYVQDSDERQHSAIMKQALESAVLRHEFPNFQVDVYALVLHNDGSALSAAITAAGLALAHAGIQMYDIITSATLGIQGDTILMDPTADEESLCEVPLCKDNDNHGILVLSMLSTHEQISQIHQTGNLSYEALTKAIETLSGMVKEVVPLVEKCLVKHVLNMTKEMFFDIQ